MVSLELIRIPDITLFATDNDDKSTLDLDKCMPLNKAAVLNKATDDSVNSGKAVTVLTYLHGVKESQTALEELRASGMDIDLIEMRSLKPLDMNTIKESLARTHKWML